LQGRCAICLQEFCEDEKEIETQTFTSRADLVRIDHCFHRFHLKCVWRDWFMERHKTKDSYGDTVEYKIPEVKRCPICRREVSPAEIEYIHGEYDR